MLPAEAPGAGAQHLPEHGGELRGAVESAALGDLGDGHPILDEQALGGIYPALDNIAVGGRPVALRKARAK